MAQCKELNLKLDLKEKFCKFPLACNTSFLTNLQFAVKLKSRSYLHRSYLNCD